MMKSVWKKAATVVLGASLVGGVLVEVPNALTTTQAQASVKISYSQYQSDISGIKGALGKAPTGTQSYVADALPKPNDKEAYQPMGSFDYYLGNLASAAQSNTDTKEQAAENLSALVATYNVFKNRLTSGEQSQLESMANKINGEIATSNVATGYWDIGNDLSGFGTTLQSAVLNYGNNYDGVGSKPTKKTSYISKLSVKKASKKYVKVTGSAKLYKSAKYARVHTYKGNKYTKLSSKHTFSKSVYAPKAKTVKVTVGNYSHGHFSSVTSTKTVHVK
ncbi:hypothetical protein IWT25_00345 [Secundilactobacillus pentosiphilus]|uniref:Surface layer protein A domain-containing protein n=1 Tax=Secundilactobacillus pentosiphilus TaxID=1714682 RepID=A0A1Z5ITW2_9LACO|nr:hypothetical protein [Secundilactobacillus pentosiphilus]GAX05042.1 hypothetical protein IWT25_00345 [Secundilactobacillus pentosiphilus]